jgi:hypothetical protein
MQSRYTDAMVEVKAKVGFRVNPELKRRLARRFETEMWLC